MSTESSDPSVFTVGDRVIRRSATTRGERELGTVVDEYGRFVVVEFEDHVERTVARSLLRRLGVRSEPPRCGIQDAYTTGRCSLSVGHDGSHYAVVGAGARRWESHA